MKLNYLCRNWQSLVENMVDLVGHGYYYVCVIPLPRRKEQKFFEIDYKIMRSYHAFYNKLQSKDKYYRRKKKGLANFRYLRWDNIAVVLHTPGMIIVSGDHYVLNTTKRKKAKDKKFLTVDQAKRQEGLTKYDIQNYVIEYTDPFEDVRQSPVVLKISDHLHLEIRLLEKIEREKPKKGEKKGEIIKRKQQVTVKMTKQMYKAKLVELKELVEHQARSKLLYSFSMINNLPSWRGIIFQKYQLKKAILDHAKKNNFKIKEEDLNVKEHRIPQKDKFIPTLVDFDREKIIYDPIEINEDSMIDESSIFE